MNSKLLEYGTEVFGEEKKFVRWYDRSNFSLGGKKPSEVSEEEAYNILRRIDYGITS